MFGKMATYIKVECHAYFPQTKLEAILKNDNILIMAYAPFGSPGNKALLTNPGESPPLALFEDPVIAKLATKHKKTPAQILIRNLLQRNLIVIPKSATPSRIKENGNVFDFDLSSEDMDTIAGIDKGLRIFRTSIMAEVPDYPFNSPE